MATSRTAGAGHAGAGDNASDRSVAELAGDLSKQLTALVHDEMALARAEMAEKGKRAGIGAGLFGGAGLLSVFGLGCLTACAVAALALVLSVWLAALIVGAAYLAAAGGMALAGRGQVDRATPPVPAEAVESTKEDVQWLKTRATSARR